MAAGSLRVLAEVRGMGSMSQRFNLSLLTPSTAHLSPLLALPQLRDLGKLFWPKVKSVQKAISSGHKILSGS